MAEPVPVVLLLLLQPELHSTYPATQSKAKVKSSVHTVRVTSLKYIYDTEC